MMTFNLNKTNQCIDIENSFEVFLFKHLNQSSDSIWIRFSGLPVGALCAATHISARVAIIAEALIKALIHIFGSIFQIDGCSFTTGVIQFRDIPVYILTGIIYTLREVILFVLTALSLTLNPKRYTEDMWLKKEFSELCSKLDQDPENEEYIYKIATFYEEGSRVDKNLKKAFELYLKLSEMNTLSSYKTGALIKLGHMYETGCYVDKNIDQAFAYYELSASRDKFLTNIMFRLGEYYETKFFSTKDEAYRIKAEYWYIRSGSDGESNLELFKQKLKNIDLNKHAI